MLKIHMRSFRFDDEVKQIIEGYEGKNLSDKFDLLVRHCFLAVPEAEKRLQELDELIAKKSNELSEICVQVNLANSIIREIKYIKEKMESIASRSDQLEGQINLHDYKDLKVV